MPELLLELFSEEIPARMQRRAAADLQKLVQDQLYEAGFMPDGAKAFATPRRLTLVVTGLPGAQPDRKEERKGPRVGAPEKAVAGFLKAAGLESLDLCETRVDKKGEFYVAVTDEKGRPTAEVIAAFMPEIIRKFPWPKAMRWGDGELRWVRPLHSVLCTFDAEIIPFDIEGISSGDITHGHRFLAPEAIQTRSFEDYELKLSRAKVVLSSEARAEQIHEEAKGLCQAQGLELVEDQGLLNEVAGLAEWPVTLMGRFDEKFLTLPDEVLISTMKGHQKYFSVKDPATGCLSNRFVFVSNIEAPDGGAAMRAGYERVLTARLSDAWFLYRQDLETSLETHAAKLEDVTFFEGLGSIGDKADRLSLLARRIAPAVGADPELADKAASLAKADLVTGMVYEFPELQGLMGRYYATAQGFDAAVADAIRDHYRPVGQGDDLPAGPVSIAVALADKIDTLTAFWTIGEKPTGSKDPFALRRAALGIISILSEGSRVQDLILIFRDAIIQHLEKLDLENFEKEIAEAFETPPWLVDAASVTERVSEQFLSTLLADKTKEYEAAVNIAYDLLEFFHDRLKVYLKDKGFRHDHVDAVRMQPNGVPEDDFVLIGKKLEALAAFLGTDDGENLLAAYKRASNILKAEEKKDNTRFTGEVDAALLTEKSETALYGAMQAAVEAFGPALAGEDFEGAMRSLARLRAPLDSFFDDVTVNTEDAALRLNRLRLLASIKQTCEQVADFSRVEG